jgi:hypothetical protein
MFNNVRLSARSRILPRGLGTQRQCLITLKTGTRPLGRRCASAAHRKRSSAISAFAKGAMEQAGTTIPVLKVRRADGVLPMPNTLISHTLFVRTAPRPDTPSDIVERVAGLGAHRRRPQSCGGATPVWHAPTAWRPRDAHHRPDPHALQVCHPKRLSPCASRLTADHDDGLQWHPSVRLPWLTACCCHSTA